MMECSHEELSVHSANRQQNTVSGSSFIVAPASSDPAEEQTSVHSRVKEWKRAIPEAGYITLGTIRYGVKLSQGCVPSNCTHFRSSSLGTVEHFNTYSSKNSMSNRPHSRNTEYDTEMQNVRDHNRKNAEHIPFPVTASSMPNVSDSDNSLSDVNSLNGSCCLNTTKCSLPWSNKVDQSRSIDSSKNRNVGMSRNMPIETTSVICSSIDQQPFSNYEASKISDNLTNVNLTSAIESCVDDFSDVESSRGSFSSPICCHNLPNKIDNHKSIKSVEQKPCVHYLDIIGKNQNKRKNHRRHSPTHRHQIACECTLKSRKSNENAINGHAPCHIENRKLFKIGHNKFGGNSIYSIGNQQPPIELNHVQTSELDENQAKFHCLDYEHNDQCCFCCYSDCKKGSRLRAIQKCDEQSVEHFSQQQQQQQKELSNSYYSSDINFHLNNNCKLYKNKNNDQSLFCKSNITTDADILNNSNAKCLVHDNFPQSYTDCVVTTTLKNSSDKCGKISKRRTEPIPSSFKQAQLNYLRRTHPLNLNENCSNCIGQLDKQFIKQIKRLQSTDYSPFVSCEPIPFVQDEQQKLVCCSKNVTAVRKTATLFMVGSERSNLVENKPKLKDKSELVRNDVIFTCQNAEINDDADFKAQYHKNIDRKNKDGESHKSIDSKNQLTSISQAKESHSKNSKRNQTINYKKRCGGDDNNDNNDNNDNGNVDTVRGGDRTHKAKSTLLDSDCDETKRLNVQTDHQHTDHNRHNEGVNGDNAEYLCHLEKLNLADTTVGSVSTEQIKQNRAHISLTSYRDDNGATTTQTAAALASFTVENELFAVDKPKQSVYNVNTWECIEQSANPIAREQCKFIEENANENATIVVNRVKTSENCHCDNENTNCQCSENLLTDESTVLSANIVNNLNDECILFEHKPIPPQATVNRNRFLNRRASFDNATEGRNLPIFISHRRTNSSGDEKNLFDRQSKLNRSYIESISDRFRYVQNTDHRYAHHLSPNTQQAMEKRMDRWQRLRFGRRAASNPPEDKKSSIDIDLNNKRSSDKLERLREITELLKVTRNNTQSPVPQSCSTESTNQSQYEIPPVPPPRKPRTSLTGRNSGSIEKFIDTSASESGSPAMTTKFDHSINEKCDNKSKNVSSMSSSMFHVPTPQQSLIDTLRPNTSATNLESLLKTRDKEKPMLTLPEESNQHKDEAPATPDILQRSNTNTNSKSIPFRSASFSQIDYSSGKYIRSALGALKASLSKAKSPPLSFACRKDQSGNSSPDEIKFNECTDIWIPLKGPGDKRNDLNLDLIDASATANMILEEECEHSPTSAKGETYESPLPLKINAAQMTTDSPQDESNAVQGVDSYFQSANACLIPVPVFECAHSDDTPEKWINSYDLNNENNLTDFSDKPLVVEANIDELPAFSEIQVETLKITDNEDSSITKNSRKGKRLSKSDELNNKLRQKTQSPTLDIDGLPAIAVTPGSSISGSSFEEMDNSSAQHSNQADYGTEYGVEVRKRYSNEDKSSENRSDDSNQSTSTSGTNSPKSHHDEKRRIDKSKRRKGMYIQWATLDKHNKELNAVSWTVGDGPTELCDKIVPEMDSSGQPIWPIGTYNDETLQVEDHEKIRKSNLHSLSSAEATSPSDISKVRGLSCNENQSAPATCEVLTPESDYCKQPVWPRGSIQARRQSLSLQSSEEKDDAPSPPTSKPRSKIFLLRSDSISDNELSDRTPPPRDRTSSQSPAPDHDLKRYSKRPLRGPYGQMLEAEMKKPAKQNYDGLLEELNRSESPYMLTAKQRDSNLHAYEDLPPFAQRSISLGKPSSSRKSSETENSLPIPMHTRAASTPAHIEAPRNEHLHSHKRYPSCVETSPRQESKKYSADSYLTRNLDDRHNKRASSETKEKMTKRNASSPAAISLLSAANEKIQRFGSDERSKMPCKQQTLPIKASPELLAELLRGSSEKMTTSERERNKKVQQHTDAYALPMAVQQFLDTRTHIVVELFNTEKSYVESLETVVKKYLNPLKSQEHSSLIESQTVDEIFLMVPAILSIHQQFLDELRSRLEIWEPLQRVGDAFVQVFSTSTVLETYTLFVNNVNRAKSAIRTTSNQRPAFARFLENMAREHKGKLTLDNLLIKPVQKFPNYELMFQRLIKHTDGEHPDQKTLQEALKLVHDILLHLNCKEREALENDQREATLRELEGVIEGVSDLVSSDRQFLSFDLVSMPHGQGGRKERGFFLFNDLLIITSIKRRSGTIKKPSTTCPMSVASTLDTNKYKLLMKIAIEDLDVIKAKDENVRKIMREIEYLTEDCTKLQQILDIALSLRCPHQNLEENVRELHKDLQRQLNDRQSNDSQLCLLELALNQTSNQIQHMTVVFPKSEKRTQWEKTFNEVKQKITAALDYQPIPEFIDKVSIRKTRAGLQFTCAAATLGAQKDVWVCNSDGYVGQVCVLSLSPEPTVTSCNGVCNARILCLASVPAFNRKLNDSIASLSSTASSSPSRKSHGSSSLEKKTSNVSTKSIASNDSGGGGTNSSSGNERDIQLDSSSSSDDSDEPEQNQPLRRLNSAKASSTPQLSTSAPNSSSDHSHIASDENTVADNQQHQPTMWLGTEDGCIHVYNCTDNIRTKKNKIKIQLVSAIYSILYLDNRVFVSLANGELVIYSRDQGGTWNTTSPQTIVLGSATNPISKLLNVNGKLWCSVQGTIKVMNSSTLQMENQLQISSDIKPITNMAVYNNQVWISVQNSAQIKCFHSKSLALLFEVNLAPSVNKMLSNCDDIIRQHKAACLRVTSLLACKDLIWIGTSAGVILTIPAASCKTSGSVSSYSSVLDQPIVTGIPYGHTGHVRFITCVDYAGKLPNNNNATENVDSTPSKKKNYSDSSNKTQTSTSKSTDHSGLLIISGGDGFEDFRSTGTNPLSDIAGREDSTNHLLLWQV